MVNRGKIFILFFSAIVFNVYTEILFINNSSYNDNIYAYRDNIIMKVIPEDIDKSKIDYSICMEKKIIYYVEYNANYNSSSPMYSIYSYSLSTTKKKLILSSNICSYSNLEVDQTGNYLFFIQDDLKMHSSNIYQIDLRNTKIRQLTKIGGYTDFQILNDNEVISIHNDQIELLNLKKNSSEIFPSNNLMKSNLILSHDRNSVFYISKIYSIEKNPDPMLEDVRSLSQASIYKLNLVNKDLSRYDFFDKTIDLFGCEITDTDSQLFVSVTVNQKGVLYEVDLNTKTTKKVFECPGIITNITYSDDKSMTNLNSNTFYTPTIDNLRFRENPVGSSKIIRKLIKGEKLELIEKGKSETIGGVKGTWVEVKTSQGEIGWCFDAYLEEVK